MLREALACYGVRETAGPGNTRDIMAWADEIAGDVRRVYTADSIPWCGLFVALDAAQTIALARAVGAHVQAAFAREADVAERIASGDITTPAQIDAVFAGAD